MALTLTGDGSITGLAVGGLPDLSVGTVDIADAAITAAKMSGAQSGSAPIYGARAWVNFNGTGTVAINASGNVTSITDNGTGDYTINFTNAFADTNYAFAGSGAANYANTLTLYIGQDSNDTRSTTQLNIHTIYNNASTAAPDDSPNVNVAVFR